MYLNLLEIFLLSILPISLIKFKIIPPKFRLVVLSGVFILLAGLIYFQDISSVQLGIKTNNFSSAIIPYLSVTIIAVFALVILSKIMKNKVAGKWYEDQHFIFLFIPISFAQQFLFQGFILFKLESIFQNLVAVIITALIFGYMHTIYPKPVFSMILGTLAGLLFATLYVIYPNLILASVIHAVLNFTAVYLGFFTFVDSEGVPEKTELNLT